MKNHPVLVICFSKGYKELVMNRQAVNDTLFLVSLLILSCWIRSTTVVPVFSQQIDPSMLRTMNFLIILVVAALAVALAGRLTPAVKTPSFSAATAVFSVVGVVLLGLPGIISVPDICTVVGGILVALGTACMLLIVGECYSTIRDSKTQWNLTASAVACALLFFMPLAVLNGTLSLVLVSLFPALFSICSALVLRT
jgi:hypothetical protein